MTKMQTHTLKDLTNEEYVVIDKMRGGELSAKLTKSAETRAFYFAERVRNLVDDIVGQLPEDFQYFCDEHGCDDISDLKNFLFHYVRNGDNHVMKSSLSELYIYPKVTELVLPMIYCELQKTLEDNHYMTEYEFNKVRKIAQSDIINAEKDIAND